MVVARDDDRASWWSRRLEATRGYALRSDARLSVVAEDWRGGAGNGLGTLNAARAASFDVIEALERGRSVAMFHAAGSGTRLEPLTSAEGGDKGAVRVPGRANPTGPDQAATLLEAVIRTTSPLARAGGGRLTVLWGDQIFLPSERITAPTADVAVHGWGRRRLDRATFEAEGWASTGVLLPGASGDRLVEKPDADSFFAEFGAAEALRSLGVFSLSPRLLSALLLSYAPELAARAGRADTDPDWWMPLTLDRATFARFRPPERWDRVDWRPHDARLAAIDLGDATRWWDLGTVPGWLAAVRSTLDDDVLRRLIGAPDPVDGALAVGGPVGARGSVLLDVPAPPEAEDVVAVGPIDQGGSRYRGVALGG